MPEGDNLICSECQEPYESNSHTRRIKNQLGQFVCPDCLVEFKKRNMAGAQKQEEEQEEEAPPAPPAKPPARKP